MHPGLLPCLHCMVKQWWYYPPLCLGTMLRQNHPLVPQHFSRTTFFPYRIGFFMVVVDAGQIFRYAGQHFMCVAWQYMHLERKLRQMGPNLRNLQGHICFCTTSSIP